MPMRRRLPSKARGHLPYLTATRCTGESDRGMAAAVARASGATTALKAAPWGMTPAAIGSRSARVRPACRDSLNLVSACWPYTAYRQTRSFNFEFAVHSTLDYLLCRSFNLELSRAAWPVRARPIGAHRPFAEVAGLGQRTLRKVEVTGAVLLYRAACGGPQGYASDALQPSQPRIP